jgi:hypothetical protein
MPSLRERLRAKYVSSEYSALQSSHASSYAGRKDIQDRSEMIWRPTHSLGDMGYFTC